MSTSVSVAIAVYNGEKYIQDQIDSILVQLESSDELVISYNESNDNTNKILQDNAKRDCRIKVYTCQEKGIIANFENAIRLCSGDIIFLADQDDVWMKNKISVVKNIFLDQDVVAIMHNCDYYNENLSSVSAEAYDRGVKNGTIRNILRNSYQGSCMAFKKELLKAILPIPRNIAMHDQWIGIIANIVGKEIIINDKLIKYRRHENVMSPDETRVPIDKKIKYIINISVMLYKRWGCILKLKYARKDTL